MSRTTIAVPLLFAAMVAGCSKQQSPTSPSPSAAPGSPATTEARIDPALGHGGRPYETSLTGAAEVPGPGDPDGSGTAEITLNHGQGEVCFALTVTGIAPATGAHIHRGGVTVAGPIVVGLTPPASGSSQGCVSAAGELINEIIQNPERFYVNVHTADFPAGAVRGQLSK